MQREFTFTFSKRYLVFESMLTLQNKFQTSDVLLFVKKKKRIRRFLITSGNLRFNGIESVTDNERKKVFKVE